MKRFTAIILAIILASNVFGRPDRASELKSKHSFIAGLKADRKVKKTESGKTKQPDLLRLAASRQFYRLLETYNLSYFEGQFDTLNRVSYYYNDFAYLPAYSVEDYYFDGSFNPANKVFYFFDGQDRDTMHITQYWEGFRNWKNGMRDTWRYDQMDNLELYLADFWDDQNNQWYLQYASRSFHEYNASGQVLSITYADYFNDQWIPWMRILNEYDNAGRHISTTEQQWEEVDGKWVNSWREEYTLNAQNEWTLVNYYLWDDFNQSWQLDSRATDISWLDFSQFKWLTVTLQYWDGTAWENDARGFSEYDAQSRLLSSTFQTWDGSAWVNNTRERYAYDAFDYQILEVYEFWEGDNWVIENGDRYDVQYNDFGYPISILRESIDFMTGDWAIAGKTLLSWEMVTSNPKNKTLEFGIYPNPVVQQLKVNLAGDIKDAAYVIYEISGKKVLSGNSVLNMIDVKQLSPGVYLLQLNYNGQSAMRKFIKN